MTITVTAIADPATCTHPWQARTGRDDSELSRWDVCAACASEALICTADCGCAQCAGEAEPEWSPIRNPEDVPAEHLSAAGLEGASEEKIDAYLDGRYEAWKAAKAGFQRIRISFPRPADGTGAILAVYADGTEDQVGMVYRTPNAPGSSAGWRADLWVAHPSLADGHLKWSARAADLAKSLTESVQKKGPWWS